MITQERNDALSHFESQFESQFARFEENHAGGSFVQGIRKSAFDQFNELGFPTPRNEEWKYTNVAPIVNTAFEPAGTNVDALTSEEFTSLDRTQFKEGQSSLLVFINGRYAPQFSSVRPLPVGVRVGSLAEVLESEPELLEPYLARIANARDHAFAALNTAFLSDGGVVYIPAGKFVDEPVRLIFISTARTGPIASHPRTLIVAGSNSQASILETYLSLGENVYLTNAVTEIVLGENATIDHYKLQKESSRAFHIALIQAYQDRSSNLTSHSFSLGGALVRNDIRVKLDGEGCESTLNGLYMVTGRQHVDNHTAMDHAQPHCNSREVYHGVLGGMSTGVFNGKIFVREDAQKTDARQTNRNLLLSETANVDTKPQLEIFADDVKCTHGATVGQLDEDSIFYLRARGIPRAEAMSLLTSAFASEIVNRIKVEPLHHRVEQLVHGWLSSVQGREKTV